MSNFALLAQGFVTAISPMNLFACLIGGIIGILVGAMPGIGAVAGCSLLLPMTYKMNPTTGIIMLAGIYYGNMFGGAYSAILLNIPGDSSAVMTSLDGYPLTRKGHAGQALFNANISSFVGGFVGIMFLTAMGPTLAKVGLKFGPAELAALVFMALTSIGWLLGDDPITCLIATGIGVLLSTIGIDQSSNHFRYTFGSFKLLAGINFIPLVIGMFGLSQVMEMLEPEDPSKQGHDYAGKLRIRDSFYSFKRFLQLLPVMLRSAVLGMFVGFLPGAGGTTGAFLSYIMEKKIGRHRNEMGTGVLEGVSASEAANNAAAAGAFVPLLALGIPGSSTTAVLLGGLQAWGLKPGPLLYEQEAEFVWGMTASMYIGNIMCVIAGILVIPILMRILKVPKKILAPIIIGVCVIGSYSVGNSIFDVEVMIIAGVAAFYMKKCGYPMAPIVLAFVLGPIFELKARQALEISNCNLLIFVQKPISAVFLGITLILCLAPVVMNVRKKIKAKKVN